jgi:large subunit ribosomal protein L25
MAEAVVLEAQQREGRGSQQARRLRKKGLVPAVLYGHKEVTVSLTLSQDALEKAIRHGVHVVELRANGKTETALIKEVQWDHLGKELMHVDFARISKDERVLIPVPIELRGTAPGLGAGGVLDQPMHTLTVECLAISIPASIRVPIGTLQVGEAIHVRDLVLPPDVKATADPDAIVVQVKAAVVEAEAPAPPSVAEQAEPEVISRQRPAEEEGG